MILYGDRNNILSVLVGNQLYCGKIIVQFASVIEGDDNNNVLVGTSGGDLIIAHIGNDRVWGREEDDCIYGEVMTILLAEPVMMK